MHQFVLIMLMNFQQTNNDIDILSIKLAIFTG